MPRNGLESINSGASSCRYKYPRELRIKEEVDYKFLLSNTMIPTSSVLVDRTKKVDFQIDLRRGGQDYATWLKLLRDGSKAYGINEALVGYRINGRSLSSNKLDSVRQIWEIQTYQEGIAKCKVAMNICKWILNSIKKYGFDRGIMSLHKALVDRANGM